MSLFRVPRFTSRATPAPRVVGYGAWDVGRCCRYFLCLRAGFPYNTASINPHTREGEYEC